MTLPSSKLGLFETAVALPLGSRGPGTYAQQFLVEGNSIISSLFIETADPGATVKVNWYDTTVGIDEGERYDLQGHPLYTGPVGPITDRQVVTRVHNKPVIEVIVTGGNVTFGCYVTVVSSFATAADAALVSNEQTVSLANDKGTALALYDSAAGKWYFAQGTAGVQSVEVIGTVTTSEFLVSNVASGEALLAYNDTATLFTITAASNLMIPRIHAGGDDDGLFSLYVDDVLWRKVRNSWNSRQVPFDVGTVKLDAGKVLRVDVTNVSPQAQSANYEGYAYYG